MASQKNMNFYPFYDERHYCSMARRPSCRQIHHPGRFLCRLRWPLSLPHQSGSKPYTAVYHRMRVCLWCLGFPSGLGRVRPPSQTLQSRSGSFPRKYSNLNSFLMANIPCSWRDGSRGAQFSIPNANVSLSLDMHLYLIDSDESWHLVATFQMPSAIHIGMFL